MLCMNAWPEMNRLRKLFKTQIDVEVTNRGIDSFTNCSNSQIGSNLTLAKMPIFP